VRVSDQIDFWLWLDAGFGDHAIEAWIIESADGTVQYVDGGITFADGNLSKRFVKIEHDVEFDGERKRPARAVLVFTDEDGKIYRVTADAPHQHVNAYYGLPMAHCQHEDLGAGGYSSISVGTAAMPSSSPRPKASRWHSPADAVRARRPHRLGHLRIAARRRGLRPITELEGNGHVGVYPGQDAGRAPSGRQRQRRGPAVTVDADFEERLTAWLRTRLPASDAVLQCAQDAELAREVVGLQQRGRPGSASAAPRPGASRGHRPG
jgi:hypothetical protein